MKPIVALWGPAWWFDRSHFCRPETRKVRRGVGNRVSLHSGALRRAIPIAVRRFDDAQELQQAIRA
jgi:hypothetical protein